MQCVKMKVVRALLLLGYCLRICYSDNQGEMKPSGFPITSEMCPQFSKSIQRNIPQYKADCNYISTESAKSIETSYLKRACILIHTMISYICKEESKIKGLIDFNLNFNKNLSVCPIEINKYFSENSYFNTLKPIFANLNNCIKICYDLEVVEEQCIALKYLNEYLSTLKEGLLLSNKDSKNTFEISKTEPYVNNTSAAVISRNISESLMDKGGPLKLNMHNVIKSKTISKQKSDENKLPKQADGSEFNFNQMNNVQNEEKITEMPGVLQEKKNLYEENEKSKDLANYETKPSSDLPSPINKEVKLQEVQKNESNSANSTPFINNNGPTENPVVDDENIDELEKQDPQSENNLVGEKEESQLSFENKKTMQDSSNQNVIYSGEGFFQAEESHFFFHFLMLSSVAIIGYLAFHNKNKVCNDFNMIQPMQCSMKFLLVLFQKKRSSN